MYFTCPPESRSGSAFGTNDAGGDRQQRASHSQLEYLGRANLLDSARSHLKTPGMTSTDQPVHDAVMTADEVALEARTALADQVLVGEQVLQSARMVGDEQDAAVWQVNRHAWMGSAAAALQDVFPAALDEFRLACNATM